MKKNSSKNIQRKLIHFPVIHTQQDLGQLKDSIRRVMLQRYGIQSLRRKTDMINQLWSAIENRLEQLKLDYTKVRLYQDALPVCGHETEIVRDLADQGSRNHRLLMHLMNKGATLTGTESSELLLAEYNHIKKEMKKESGSVGSAPEAASKNAENILKKRDRFISERIGQTLLPGETGILFLGLLHNVPLYLPGDIRVIDPFSRQVANIFQQGGDTS